MEAGPYRGSGAQGLRGSDRQHVASADHLRELDPAPDIESPIDLAEMGLHRLGGSPRRAGDLPGGRPLGREEGDLPLDGRQEQVRGEVEGLRAPEGHEGCALTISAYQAPRGPDRPVDREPPRLGASPGRPLDQVRIGFGRAEEQPAIRVQDEPHLVLELKARRKTAVKTIEEPLVPQGRRSARKPDEDEPRLNPWPRSKEHGPASSHIPDSVEPEDPASTEPGRLRADVRGVGLGPPTDAWLTPEDPPSVRGAVEAHHLLEPSGARPEPVDHLAQSLLDTLEERHDRAFNNAHTKP